MSQATQVKATPEVVPVIEMANQLFCLDDGDIDQNEVSENTVEFRGNGFNYELIDMYRDPSEVERKGEYTCSIPNAGDDGSNNEIVVESIKASRQTMFVVYDIYQPENKDSDWVCSGLLSLTLTTSETHEALLKETVDRLKKDNEASAVSMAKSLLESVASDDESLGRMAETLLTDMVASAVYVYDRDKDEIQPKGPVSVYHAIGMIDKMASKDMGQAWAGAFIASLLVEHTLVESFILQMSTSEQYDDNNYFTSKNVAVTDLVFVNGVQSVVLEDQGGEEIDADGYADILKEAIEDGSEWDIYDGFAPYRDDRDEFMVQVRRSDLKALLEGEQIDGAAVGKLVARTWECHQ